ncbi:hypothetical protein PGT21_024474 [Puccinia graminis f. sp. tritici]|uniref:Uncharacterized protein n=1 Tax=Puccinia graminis f. sp. tritici TaxID=56615 RepID=A0A5B0MFS0_PUCGR|nr:hypothetical protein PGT21_024474 [Puccinia graminis f. sp. tritici]
MSNRNNPNEASPTAIPIPSQAQAGPRSQKPQAKANPASRVPEADRSIPVVQSASEG